MAKKAHSSLGASSAHRWLSCPGSIRLSKGMPSISSEYAKEGTAAHELGETCIRSGTDAIAHLGAQITVQGTIFEVTEEMAAAVQVYLDTVRADLAVVGQGAKLSLEHKFHLDWLYPGLYGTNDAMIDQPFGLLRVYDYKHGAGVAVDAEDNAQMMYYALGGAKDNASEEVELVIVQPRAVHPEGAVRRCRMTIGELERWGQEVLLPGAIATKDPAAPLNAGEGCRFCPALAVCPVQKERAMVVAAEVFAPQPKAPPMPGEMTHAMLRKVLDASGLVESWFAACRVYARTLLETGQVTSEEIGYKLVEGRASRKWKDEAEAATFLEAILGKEDTYVTKVVSVSQAEKVLKGASKKALEEFVVVTRGQQMVPVSDKRAALPPAATLAFDAVEEL
jgi:hypothetical protein